MGVTVDLIPRLPGENPDDAIARIYDGGMAIVVDVDPVAGRVEEIANDVEAAPEGAFDEWRAEVLRRLHELFPDWLSTEDDGYPVLWTPGCAWQIEFNSDDITLRARRPEPAGAGPNDRELLGLFAGLRTIVHWPDEYGEFVDLDDPERVPDNIG